MHRTFVSAAVRRAVRENLLSVRIQRLPIVKRDAVLEEELIKRFPRLAVTRVVEEGPAPEAEQDPQQDEYDLHTRVGTAMSSAIAEENLIHTGAVCLVGSGRAVAHTALALGQRSEPLKSRRVKLLSLSGGYPLMTVCSSRAIGIDADTCTRALAQAFAENVEVHTMTFPIMAPTASAMKLFREMSWIGVANRGGKEGRQPAPEIALLGVGGLNPHNDPRFGFMEEHHWEGSAAFKSLKSLIELRATIRDKDCVLVADIANHFVAVREDERFLPRKDKARIHRRAPAAQPRPAVAAGQPARVAGRDPAGGGRPVRAEGQGHLPVPGRRAAHGARPRRGEGITPPAPGASAAAADQGAVREPRDRATDRRPRPGARGPSRERSMTSRRPSSRWR